MATTRPFIFLRGGALTAFELTMLMPDGVEGVITHILGKTTVADHGDFRLDVGPAGDFVTCFGSSANTVGGFPVFYTGLMIPVKPSDVVSLTWAGGTDADIMTVYVTGFIYPAGDTFDGQPAGGGGGMQLNPFF